MLNNTNSRRMIARRLFLFYHRRRLCGAMCQRVALEWWIGDRRLIAHTQLPIRCIIVHSLTHRGQAARLAHAVQRNQLRIEELNKLLDPRP